MSQPPMKPNDTLWCVPMGGQSSTLSDETCLVTVVSIEQTPELGMSVPLRLATLSNGAKIHTGTLRGYIERHWVEDFGSIKTDAGIVERKVPQVAKEPVRCWRSKAHWEEHVETQRAWNKLASRILTHAVDDMEPFTVEDIEAAELALFGNIQK